MTEPTIVERQRNIAVAALHQIIRGTIADLTADRALAEIAALDTPPQPDLAEIGSRAHNLAYNEAANRGDKNANYVAFMAAYAAMRAADDAGRRRDVEADPRVRELRDVVETILNWGVLTNAQPFLRRTQAAIAAFETVEAGPADPEPPAPTEAEEDDRAEFWRGDKLFVAKVNTARGTDWRRTAMELLYWINDAWTAEEIGRLRVDSRITLDGLKLADEKLWKDVTMAANARVAELDPATAQ